MKTQETRTRAVRPARPEDLRAGHYVAVTRIRIEETPLFCDAAVKQEIPVMRAWLIPAGAGDPLRIISVCLPFILVENPQRRCRTLDLRRMEIVRLPKRYARTAFQRLSRPPFGPGGLPA